MDTPTQIGIYPVTDICLCHLQRAAAGRQLSLLMCSEHFLTSFHQVEASLMHAVYCVPYDK
eukprot:scaffold29213_cov177-Skeletonema_menzelii.AAC.2